MNSISIEGEKYVKATYIARELGYTPDYVGQLCRAHKVEAARVGRNWYVLEKSIRDHKKTRYRSTKTTSKKVLKEALYTRDADTQESYSIPVHTKQTTEKSGNNSTYAQQQFYTRTPKKKETSYFLDNNDLIPTGSGFKAKTGYLSVVLADAKEVQVHSQAKESDFSPTQKPDLQFSGTLAVTLVEDEDEVKGDQEPIKTAQEQLKNDAVMVQEEKLDTRVQKPTVKHANKIKVTHLRKDTNRKLRNLPVEHNVDGVVGMKKAIQMEPNSTVNTPEVTPLEEDLATNSSYLWIIILTLVFSMGVAIFILGLETHVTVEGGTLLRSFVFKISEVLATIYGVI